MMPRAASQCTAAPAHRTLRIEAGQLSAHEMSLVQQQAVLGRQLIDTNKHTLLERPDIAIASRTCASTRRTPPSRACPKR